MRHAVEGTTIRAGGRYSQLVLKFLQQKCEVPWGRLTSSGTSALEVGALALDLESGAEVIVPSYTYVTTASSFARVGAVIRFADIDKQTLTIDPVKVTDLLTSRTSAIVAMHYGGIPCDMDALAKLAKDSGASLIEDNAHGFGGRYRGHSLGSFGRYSIISFDWLKNFTSGEGGAILCNDADLCGRIQTICDRGTNRSNFERGECERYEWTTLGTNVDMSELVAAFLHDQLRHFERVQAARQRNWSWLDQALCQWANINGVTLPQVPPDCVSACHAYYVVMPKAELLKPFIAHMRAHSVETAAHFSPLHNSEFGRKMESIDECPVTEIVAASLARIPCHHGLNEAEIELVQRAVKSFKW